jgi:hypothetical protein
MKVPLPIDFMLILLSLAKEFGQTDQRPCRSEVPALTLVSRPTRSCWGEEFFFLKVIFGELFENLLSSEVNIRKTVLSVKQKRPPGYNNCGALIH